jgi:hypothetical protein
MKHLSLHQQLCNPALVLRACGFSPSIAIFLVLAVACVSAHAQQALIYDDDCSQDVDCVATLPILHALADRGEVRILAMVADSANPLTAPVLRLFANYAGHPGLAIGANQTAQPDNPNCVKWKCNESVWATGLVQRFNSGDTRRKYPDCVTTYRHALADQPAHSVVIAETGFAACLIQLLHSPADKISPLSGAQLVQQKVKLLSIMGGRYPAGTEWNFECDAPEYHELFALWTRQNGYPPVYLNGFENGEKILAGAPADASPKVNPTVYGMQLASTKQRPMWDMLSALYAARSLAYKGTPYFTVSEPGTVAVDAKTGADTWSSATDSGHYVLTNAAPVETFERIFDGYTYHTGFLATPPPKAARKP